MNDFENMDKQGKADTCLMESSGITDRKDNDGDDVSRDERLGSERVDPLPGR
jgi:hypothetical protein